MRNILFVSLLSCSTIFASADFAIPPKKIVSYEIAGQCVQAYNKGNHDPLKGMLNGWLRGGQRINFDDCRTELSRWLEKTNSTFDAHRANGGWGILQGMKNYVNDMVFDSTHEACKLSAKKEHDRIAELLNRLQAPDVLSDLAQTAKILADSMKDLATPVQAG